MCSIGSLARRLSMRSYSTFLTKYPERYRRRNDAPDYFEYVQRPAVLIGRDCSEVVGTDGTIIASKRDEHEQSRYWLDPDLSLYGKENVVHLIWICDMWQLFTVEGFSTDRFRHERDIEASLVAKT